MRGLARRLVPLDFTASPHFFQDAALPPSSLPALSIAKGMKELSEDQKKFALVQLKRGANHVAGALRRVREFLELQGA